MKQNKNKLKTKNFQFKYFSIQGGEAGMPVSTDGVLLGAWADITPTGRLLDIGTGTGLLSLMCAQRFPDLHITALDIDDEAIRSAQTNIQFSHWSQRITLEQGNAETYTTATPFTDIICNPPYFNSGETAQVTQRAIARHSTELNHAVLANQCYKLTNSDGKAHFILPETEGRHFIHLAESVGWHLHHYVSVFPNQEKPCHRLLLSFGKIHHQIKRYALTIRNKNEYSPEFIELTRNFYLKM